MIIRAVSSDDDDDSDDAVAQPFSTGDLPAPTDARGTSASTSVKLAWLGVSLALIALLMLDLAALLNQFFPTSDALAPPRADPFTVVSWITLMWRGRVASFQPATLLNNVVGQLFVCAWIYCRETALAPQRQRSSSRHERIGSVQVSAYIIQKLPLFLVLAELCLGHVVSCAYILFALFESHGGSVRTKFWLGRSSIGSRTAPRV